MLGLNVIKQLLPHRNPFLMVDTIKEYENNDKPILYAERNISNKEPLFHFSEQPPQNWPFIYVLEGLGQSCNLLGILRAIELNFISKDLDPKDMFKLFRDNAEPKKERILPESTKDIIKKFARIGMLASVDVEIVDQAKAGDLLHYKVEQTLNYGEFYHYTVNAHTANKTLIKGTMVGALGAI